MKESLEDQVDKFMQKMEENFIDNDNQKNPLQAGLRLEDLFGKDFENRMRNIDMKAALFNNNMPVVNKTEGKNMPTSPAVNGTVPGGNQPGFFTCSFRIYKILWQA
jgi:hypothetical protein